MQEFMATSERRAELYWWFSTLFAAELSDAQIAEYDTYDVRSLKSLSTLDPMREAVAELNDAIARLLVRPRAPDGLAADFAGLFWSAPGQGALPYNPLPGRGQADAGPMTEMQARLDRLGINVSDKYNEPADHLAIRLDLMGSLIIRAARSTTAAQREAWLGEQESLLHGHLLGWFERFEQACRAADKFGFYGASARLLGCSSRWTPTTSPWSNRHRPPTEPGMKTALLLIACWLLAPDPAGSGSPLVTLLFNPDRALYGTAQLTGFAGILLTSTSPISGWKWCCVAASR